MKDKTATIFDIQRNSFIDGPGIRTTVFFKGCNLRCSWCHNPESQSFEPEMMFYEDKCTHCGLCASVCPHNLEKCETCGKCAKICPANARTVCGSVYTAEEVLRQILKDKRFYDNSGGGVTFSGGECMLQIDFLEDLLKKCKEIGIHTAVDTAGHIPFSYFQRILPYTDLFLYDIKCFDSSVHQEYVGVTNDLILSNLKKLLQFGAKVWIRIPIITGVNDTSEEMENIRNLLTDFGKPEKIELLPYHSMGENKYPAIGRAPMVFSVPEAKKIKKLYHVFTEK